MDIDNQICDNINPTSTQMDTDISTLSNRQQYIFDCIILALENPEAPRYFFIDGPGGSGKSFLLNHIINHMDTINVKVTSVAWTGN